MASHSPFKVESLAVQLAADLHLVGQTTECALEDSEEAIVANAAETEFDDIALTHRFIEAVTTNLVQSQKQATKDISFKNQLMLPFTVDTAEQLPTDFRQDWVCVVCPAGTRTLLIAAHNTTKVYDVEGTLLCEHDTHLPSGSTSVVSKVADPIECSVVDCIYSDEEQIYYVLDVMCWRRELLYKEKTVYRFQYLQKNIQATHTLKDILQTNPYKLIPLSNTTCSQAAMFKALRSVDFKPAGLLLYSKAAHYTPGVQPMVCWLDVYHIDLVLDVFAPCSNSVQNLASSAQQRGRHSWRLNRYAACKTILTKPYSDSSNSSSSIGVAPGSYPGAVKRRQRVARRQHHDVDYYGYDGYNTCATYNYDTSFLANQNVNNNNFSMNVYWNQKYGMEVDQNQKYGMAVNRNQKGGSLRSQRLETSWASNASACVDKTPNWEEQHDVMMSVCMEKVPPRFAEDWLAVVCPVAKRRIVVAYLGSTCSYNKLGHVDRKFQSRLPGGNTQSVQVIESNDMCILDCLHLKAERTFYVLDIMFWKQFPYYQSDAEFRFNWIRDKFTDSFYTKLSSDNQYMFKPLFQFPCTKEDIVKVVRETTFKVDGLLFFYRLGWYTPGVSANVLWLRPENMHSILGLQQSEDLSPDVKLSRCDGSRDSTCNTSGVDVRSDDSGSNMCNTSGADVKSDDSRSNTCAASGVDIRSDDSGSNICNTSGVDIRFDDSGSNMCNTSGVDIRSDDSGSNVCNTRGVDIRSDDSGSNMCNTSGVDIRSDDSGSNVCNTRGVDIRSDDSGSNMCNTSGVDIRSDDSGSNMCNTSGVDIRSDDSGSNMGNTSGVDIRSDDSGSSMCNTSGVDIRSDDS